MARQELKRLRRNVKKLCQIMADIFNEGQVWKAQRTTKNSLKERRQTMNAALARKAFTASITSPKLTQ